MIKISGMQETIDGHKYFLTETLCLGNLGEDIPETDVKFKVNRLVESFSHGFGRIISVTDYGKNHVIFTVKWSYCNNLEITYNTEDDFWMKGLKFFNDDESAYLN
jgi:hypothetical protein